MSDTKAAEEQSTLASNEHTSSPLVSELKALFALKGVKHHILYAQAASKMAAGTVYSPLIVKYWEDCNELFGDQSQLQVDGTDIQKFSTLAALSSAEIMLFQLTTDNLKRLLSTVRLLAGAGKAGHVPLYISYATDHALTNAVNGKSKDYDSLSYFSQQIGAAKPADAPIALDALYISMPDDVEAADKLISQILFAVKADVCARAREQINKVSSLLLYEFGDHQHEAVQAWKYLESSFPAPTDNLTGKSDSANSGSKPFAVFLVSPYATKTVQAAAAKLGASSAKLASMQDAAQLSAMLAGKSTASASKLRADIDKLAGDRGVVVPYIASVKSTPPMLGDAFAMTPNPVIGVVSGFHNAVTLSCHDQKHASGYNASYASCHDQKHASGYNASYAHRSKIAARSSDVAAILSLKSDAGLLVLDHDGLTRSAATSDIARLANEEPGNSIFSLAAVFNGLLRLRSLAYVHYFDFHYIGELLSSGNAARKLAQLKRAIKRRAKTDVKGNATPALVAEELGISEALFKFQAALGQRILIGTANTLPLRYQKLIQPAIKEANDKNRAKRTLPGCSFIEAPRVAERARPLLTAAVEHFESTLRNNLPSSQMAVSRYMRFLGAIGSTDADFAWDTDDNEKALKDLSTECSSTLLSALDVRSVLCEKSKLCTLLRSNTTLRLDMRPWNALKTAEDLSANSKRPKSKAEARKSGLETYRSYFTRLHIYKNIFKNPYTEATDLTPAQCASVRKAVCQAPAVAPHLAAAIAQLTVHLEWLLLRLEKEATAVPGFTVSKGANGTFKIKFLALSRWNFKNAFFESDKLRRACYSSITIKRGTLPWLVDVNINPSKTKVCFVPGSADTQHAIREFQPGKSEAAHKTTVAPSYSLASVDRFSIGTITDSRRRRQAIRVCDDSLFGAVLHCDSLPLDGKNEKQRQVIKNKAMADSDVRRAFNKTFDEVLLKVATLAALVNLTKYFNVTTTQLRSEIKRAATSKPKVAHQRASEKIVAYSALTAIDRLQAQTRLSNKRSRKKKSTQLAVDVEVANALDMVQTLVQNHVSSTVQTKGDSSHGS